MDESRSEAIASFRYGVIAPVLTRQLVRGEQAELLRELASKSYRIPFSGRTTIHVRTLERWLEAYRKGGYQGLVPVLRQDHGRPKSLSPELVQKAVALRREVPGRSTEQIIRILELSGQVEPGVLKRSTLGRHLGRLGARRRDLEKPKRAARRFSAPQPNALWQSDVQHSLWLPDPGQPRKKRRAYLIAVLDDYSRFVPHGQFYFEENLPKLEDCLKKAISRSGLPQTLYVDQGAIYNSGHLKRISGELGIRLVHSRPYRPQGRGKIERWFGYVEQSFVPEAYSLIETGRLKSLAELNEFFWAWLEVAYHQKRHASTKQTPRARYQEGGHNPRRVPPQRLRHVFLWRESRKVDKTGTLQIAGNRYEVEPQLVGKRVEVRYDPYDLAEIEVTSDGRHWPDIRPVALERPRHPKLQEPLPDKPSPTGLNFLELARRERELQLRRSQQDRFRRLEEREKT